MKILLITPPLTQPNTPYPATAYLTAFLRAAGHDAHQADLGIELLGRLFSAEVLQRLFDGVSPVARRRLSPNARHILAQKGRYVGTIEATMRFLRGHDPCLAMRLAGGGILPRAARFENVAELDWAFGALGITERARHLATLYLEDLSDFIAEAVSPAFRLGRYAEHLSVQAPDFGPLAAALKKAPDPVDALMLDLLDARVRQWRPELVGFSIPFPGNVYAALRCGQHLKRRHRSVKVVWGGGYVSTELRQLTDPAVFDYVDYVVLDEGEPALQRLTEHLDGQCGPESLSSTLFRTGKRVVRTNAARTPGVRPTTTPDFSELPLDSYVSLIETANPASKLWSDGRWNKMMLARGCYWAKCAFCDTSLPYISAYRPGQAERLVDQMEAVMKQTGSSGFHFVDEAAPPKVLRDISKELLRRGLAVTWWTNIRFEKSFTPELCELMAEAGCIAVSAGLEVASNRVLQLMNKGVTVEQAARVAAAMAGSGIMVHAYLMYGFPGQTMRETVDALELVRQMFAEGWVHSAFWHRYAMTVHSPSGMDPAAYGARRLDRQPGRFANNEVPFTDDGDVDLDMLGEGLRRAVFNYMHGLGLELPVHRWFAGKVPRTKVGRQHLRCAVLEQAAV